MKIIKVIAAILLFIIAVALGSQNQELVNFNYLLAQGDFHLSTLLGVVFVSGFTCAWLLFFSIHMKLKLKIRRLNKQLKKQQSSVPAEAEQA